MLPEEYSRLNRETASIPLATKAVMVISLETENDLDEKSTYMAIKSYGSPYELKDLKMRLVKNLKKIATDEKIQLL